MGKVVKFSGSRLLGEELRRLRGGRTLDDVVELGKAKLHEFGFRSVAKTTLSEIENGRALPNIESVFALSILYQVPTSKFLHILLEENLIEGRDLGDPSESQGELFAAALASRRTTEALAIALQALRNAAPGWESLRWRLNRAVATDRLGMRGDAIGELQACLENGDLPARMRFAVHRELARIHADGAQFLLAEMHIKECIANAPPDLSPLECSRLLQARISARFGRKECGLEQAMVGLDELEELINEGVALAADLPELDRLILDLYRADLAVLRGQDKAARKQYLSILAKARALSLPDRQVEALQGLARIERAYEPEQARVYLRSAAEIAVDINDIDSAFLIFFALYDLAESSEQAAFYLRKCRRLYPLVQSAHPLVKRFERLNGREVAR